MDKKDVKTIWDKELGEEREVTDEEYEKWLKEIKKKVRIFRFQDNIRKGIYRVLRKNKLGKKRKRTEEILGCTIDQFYSYIEVRLKPGMTMENYGKVWHIDHIIPLFTGKTMKDAERLNHYTNLQPLEAAINCGSKKTEDLKKYGKKI